MAGDARAQVTLGEKILAAGGDASEAGQWIEKSAASGDPHGMVAQARRLARLSGKDAEVLALLTRAAEQGDPRRRVEIARAGAAGVKDIDAETALRWLRAAADAGHPAAQATLGERYAIGNGVDADLAKARGVVRALGRTGLCAGAGGASGSSIRPATAPT